MSDSAAEPEPVSADQTPEQPASPAETITIPAAEFEAAKREAQDWKERCLRNQAEFDNVRKRLRKDADEAGTRAVARAMKPLLNEIDNLQRAIEAAKPEAFVEFAQGVSLIRENLRMALSGVGIEPVPCEGIFDPAVHEVIAEEESADVPKGTIVKIHRQGYRVKDQLVRSAQVIVAKPPAAG